ncbi:MAG: radical SAM protein [bacterium]|nr:radical SAM protein [bacterium]
MKYKSCHYVNHCLSFNDSRIVYCTLGNTAKNKQYAVLKENYNGEPIDWEKLLDRIEADKQSHRDGVIIDSCKDCMMLSEKDWDEETEPRKFKYILFSNWYACNSACRYCWKDEKDFLIEDVDANSKINPNDTYDIIPIVRDLIDKNLLTDDATIDFAGGEPTMYYKFDEALKMFIDAKIKHIIIHTNAINYSKEIERAVREGIAELLISVDAGTKEVHQDVKRVV